MARLALAGCMVLLAGCVTAPRERECTMAAEDHAWLADSLQSWPFAERQDLHLDPAPLPTFVAIDSKCSYLFTDGALAQARATRHGETVRMPDGAEVPVGPISFANYTSAGYFAMSLPSVWRAAAVTSEVGLGRLMEGVMHHELAHTRQGALATPLIARYGAAAGIADEAMSDDIIQDRFAGNAAYLAEWQHERALLFAAAAAPSDDEARALAGQALAAMGARRARWFTRSEASLGELDGIYLTMEGVGQWLMYRLFRSPEGGVLSPDAALAATRRGGSQWSQDEGLAVILVVDRLLPGWQERAFREPDWRAENLLAAALQSEAPAP